MFSKDSLVSWNGKSTLLELHPINCVSVDEGRIMVDGDWEVVHGSIKSGFLGPNSEPLASNFLVPNSVPPLPNSLTANSSVLLLVVVLGLVFT